VIDNGIEKVESNSTLNIHAKAKLESKLEPTMTFNIGEQGQIPIRLTGENNIITWFKDSQPISFDDRIRFVTEENNSYKLIIDDLRSDDKGLYSMHVENKGGSLDVKTTLNIKEQKPQILADLNDSPAANSAKIGEEFSLEIRAQGKPRPQVTWLLNGQELSADSSSDYDFVVTEDGLYRIVFHQFNERYIGEYQAVITSSAGTIKTKKVKVTGQQVPIFTQEPPKSLQVKTGEKLTVECTAKGHPTPKLTWLRDGKVLTNKDGFDIKIDQTTGQAAFIIPNATVKHSGKYECKVENQYGTHTTEINIDVLGKNEEIFIRIFCFFVLAPPTAQQKMQDFEISRGQEVTITVTADGSPLPTCTWFHNDKPIQVQPDRIVIIDDGSTHTLKLLDVQLNDDGQYKVKQNEYSLW
jgi:hemicentin